MRISYQNMYMCISTYLSIYLSICLCIHVYVPAIINDLSFDRLGSQLLGSSRSEIHAKKAAAL